VTKLTLEQARVALDAALHHAQQLGAAVSVVIVDERGERITTAKQDEALIISPGFAEKKAFTAVALGCDTDASALASDAVNAIRIMVSDPRLCFAAGGSPIRRAGRIVGAIGVAGGTTETDRACCVAGVAACAELDTNGGR
jgi:uncharacterized protein GlcG (DUF336 family)